MSPLRIVDKDEQLIAIIWQKISDYNRKSVEFLTPSHMNLQVGVINGPYPYFLEGPVEGRLVPAHKHPPRERSITGTGEILIVLQGSIDIKFFDNDDTLIFTHLMRSGDVVYFIAGGHEVLIKSGSQVLEVKQGPYVESLDKCSIPKEVTDAGI